MGGLFSLHVYLQVRENRMVLRILDRAAIADIRAKTPFSTDRLLVGDFLAAERCLSECVKAVGGLPWIGIPQVVAHPLEKVQGGLSPVEERCLLELVDTALGRSKTRIWVGDVLQDHDIRRVLSED